MASSDNTCGWGIVYEKDGVQPPVYVAGSFTDPAWEVQEMLVEQKENGEYRFSKIVSVPEDTEIFYKIRIGEEFWVYDETKRTTTGEDGSTINVVKTPDFSYYEIPEGFDVEEFLAGAEEDDDESTDEDVRMVRAGAYDPPAEPEDAYEYDHDYEAGNYTFSPWLPHEELDASEIATVVGDEDAAPAFGYEHAGVFPSEQMPSPLIRASRRSSSDISAELSPPASPASTRNNMLSLPLRHSRDRTPERNRSLVSLNAIAEEEDAVAGVGASECQTPPPEASLRKSHDESSMAEEFKLWRAADASPTIGDLETTEVHDAIPVAQTPKSLGKGKGKESVETGVADESEVDQPALVHHKDLAAVQDEESVGPESPDTVIHHDVTSKTDIIPNDPIEEVGSVQSLNKEFLGRSAAVSKVSQDDAGSESPATVIHHDITSDTDAVPNEATTEVSCLRLSENEIIGRPSAVSALSDDDAGPGSLGTVIHHAITSDTDAVTDAPINGASRINPVLTRPANGSISSVGNLHGGASVPKVAAGHISSREAIPRVSNSGLSHRSATSASIHSIGAESRNSAS